MTEIHMKKGLKSKGQVTIFIILGILIVVAGILIYLFYPNIQGALGFSSESPSQYMQTCIEDKVIEAVEKLSIHGGSIIPEFTYSYNNEDLEYLCYTNQDYKTCVNQRPMLKEHVEKEIRGYILADVDSCLTSLEETYSRKYSVDLKKGPLSVEIAPKNIIIVSNSSLTLKKGESSTYPNIKVNVKNNLYELVSIATNIIQFESKYGDTETTDYMNYYHDLKVEKLKQSEGTTVYILTNRNTKEKFQFASRSVAWPIGY